MRSTRLPNKMLLPFGAETLLERVYRLTTEAFGEHTVIATTADAANDPIEQEAARIGATCFRWDGAEADVLGRFAACASTYRWHPDSVIVRVTPDDWRKNPGAMRLVASGERLPVEVGGEAFTLKQLLHAHRETPRTAQSREHITYALFRYPAPAMNASGVWTIDTQADYDAALAAMGEA